PLANLLSRCGKHSDFHKRLILPRSVLPHSFYLTVHKHYGANPRRGTKHLAFVLLGKQRLNISTLRQHVHIKHRQQSHTILRFHFLHRFKRRLQRCCLPPLHVHRFHLIPQRLEHLLPEGPPSAVPPEAEVSRRGWAIRPEVAPCDLLLRLLRLPLLPLS